jgi:hypothetical protein
MSEASSLRAVVDGAGGAPAVERMHTALLASAVVIRTAQSAVAA